MALLECPECGGNVSSKAEVCPHCGYPMGDPPSAPAESKERDPEPGKETLYKFECLGYRWKRHGARVVVVKEPMGGEARLLWGAEFVQYVSAKILAAPKGEFEPSQPREADKGLPMPLRLFVLVVVAAAIGVGIYFGNVADSERKAELAVERAERESRKAAEKAAFEALPIEEQTRILAERAAEEERRVQDEAERRERYAREALFKKDFSSWDGRHLGLAKMVKDSLKDPSSFDHVETSYKIEGDRILLNMTYRGVNSFGAVVTESIWARAEAGGRIVEIIED